MARTGYALEVRSVKPLPGGEAVPYESTERFREPGILSRCTAQAHHLRAVAAD